MHYGLKVRTNLLICTCKRKLVCVCCEVVGSATRSQPTVAEMSKLEAEINFLKRSLDVGKSTVVVSGIFIILLCANLKCLKTF